MDRQSIHRQRMNCHFNHADDARLWASRLEDLEALKRGVSVSAARKVVAQRLRVSPGTLENLRRGRLKVVAITLYERLRNAIERDLTAEIHALETELAIACAKGMGSDEGAFRAAAAALEDARHALAHD